MRLTFNTPNPAPVPHTLIIGDTDPETGSCAIVVQDRDGQELDVFTAPEDDMIPYLRTRGYRVGVYAGNYTYNLLNN